MKCTICGGEVIDLAAGCPQCDVATAKRLPSEIEDRVGEGAGRFSPGSVLAGRYRLLYLLGRGGMGEVYRAEDLRLGQQVALKFLSPAREQDPAMRERFLDEVRLARRVSHGNVCRVYDVGEAGGRLFLSMEYVDGEDLKTLLKRIGRLPRERAAEMSVRICRGLAAIHAQGILHRDLKPSNVMIDGDGQPRLTDFGLAALAESDQGDEVSGGTPAYMAPELFLGQAATIRSDLYALGLVTWELFTGRRAVPGHPLTELARRQREAEPMPPSPEEVELDPAVERVVRWCLEKDPRDRPASAEAVEAALVADAGPEPGTFLKTVVVSDLAGGEGAEGRGRVTRDLLAEHGGREISTAEGPVWLFERPWGAVCFALACHQAPEGGAAAARIGVHLGEVTLRRSSRREAAAAGPIVAEGPGVAMARRLSGLAREGQTLMTAHAFDLARQHSMCEAAPEGKVRWLSHGSYLLRGQEEAAEIFEVGVEGIAPLAAPESSEQAMAVLGQGYVPGWRPAPGAAIPQRPHWKIERNLGAGGFGDMWLARHAKTREARVFKFCYDASRLRALQREITIFRLLKEQLGERPDVTRILDWNFDQAPYFIESEYTAGGSLVEWAEEQGGLDRVPLEVRLEIVAQVATALSAAHSVGVLHKDVKPGNVLIAAGEGGAVRAQLSDFGIGLVTDRDRLAAAGITVAGLTERTEPGSGSSLSGTRLYMAPELLEGKPPTLQADVYALGVMLYQMVVGDFSRALAPGWRREVADELLREDVAAAVDGVPERRLGDARLLAERLRTLDERRAHDAAERQMREAAERARKALERHRVRRRLAAVVLGAALLFAAAMGLLARRVAQEAERANVAASRARDMARVAVAGEWLARDPTSAAVLLLEIEHPERIPQAVARMREVVEHPLAILELRHQVWLRAAAWSPDGQRLLTVTKDIVRIWNLAEPGRPTSGMPIVFDPRGPVRNAAWSLDGRHIAAACSDGTAHLWDAFQEGESLVLNNHEGEVAAPSWQKPSWSPDSQRVAIAYQDGTARIWNLDDVGQPVVLRGHQGAVFGVRFDDGGDRLVTASEDGTARIWNVDGGEVAVLKHAEAVRSARFSPRDGRVLSASADGTARIWNLGGGGEAIVLRHPGLFDAAEWSPDGKRVATASSGGTARIWNADGSGEPVVLAGHDGIVESVAWSPDGQRLATAAFDGTARVWRADGSGQSIVLAGHDAPVVLAAFQPGGERLATGGLSGVVRVWSLSDSGGPTVLAGHAVWVYSTSFDPRGERLATVSGDGTVRIWDVATGAETVVLHGHEAPVWGVAWSPDGDRVASSSVDGTARIWNMTDGGEPIVLRGHTGVIQTVSWSADGGRLATASLDGTARIWTIAPAVGNGKPLVLRGHDHYVYSVTWSPDGERVATSSEDGTVRIWNVETGDGTIVHQHKAGLIDVAWSPDGERILIGAADGVAWIRNADGSDVPLLLSGHASAVLQAAWSPDGSRVATASWDNTVRLWPADGHGEPILLSGHEGPVSGVSFSPDGERLVTSSADGTARIWRLHLDVSELQAAIRAATAVCLVPKFRENTLGETPAEALAAYEECERSHGR